MTRTSAVTARMSTTEDERSSDISKPRADHHQVEAWFEEFENARSESEKQEVVEKICNALKAPTPALLEATEDEDLHDEAEVEHEGAKKLIADIEAKGPDDGYFDARVSGCQCCARRSVSVTRGG